MKTCLACQAQKSKGITQRPQTEYIRISDSRFHQIDLDIVGSLSYRYQYCLIAIGRFTRSQLRLVPIKDINSRHNCKHILSKLDLPFRHISNRDYNRGSQFKPRSHPIDQRTQDQDNGLSSFIQRYVTSCELHNFFISGMTDRI